MARVAIVTGGTRGIGEAISVALKNLGMEVAANYAGNDERAREFSNRTGIKSYKWNVADFDACQQGVAQVEELRSACVEADVKLIGCQMTVDLFGYAHQDFIPEVKEYVGAATFLPMARDADVSLFI